MLLRRGVEHNWLSWRMIGDIRGRFDKDGNEGIRSIHVASEPCLNVWYLYLNEWFYYSGLALILLFAFNRIYLRLQQKKVNLHINTSLDYIIIDYCTMYRYHHNIIT